MELVLKSCLVFTQNDCRNRNRHEQLCQTYFEIGNSLYVSVVVAKCMFINENQNSVQKLVFGRDVAISLARYKQILKTYIYVHIYQYNEKYFKVLISHNQIIIIIINADTSRMKMQTIYEKCYLSPTGAPSRQRLYPRFYCPYLSWFSELLQIVSKQCKNNLNI